MNHVNIDISVQCDPNEEHFYLITASTTGRRRKIEVGRFYLSPDTWIDVDSSLRILKARDATTHDHRQKIRDFGKYLFNRLINGNIRHLYDEKKQDASAKKSGILRLRLTLASLDLVALPWELLFDERDSEYLCLMQKPRIILIRSIKNVKSIRRSNCDAPLSIVGMIADPRNLPLVGEREKYIIEQALKPLRDNKQVTLIWKQGKQKDLPDLRLSADRIDIFHFIGHGRFNEDEQQGYLEFEDDNKLSRSISAEKFRLSLHPTTKLVVLNACETARGIAHSLASTGIPAVVAMQFKILDSASHLFAKTFYTLLARGTAIDEAVAEARYVIHNMADEQDSLDWAAPLLYVSSSNILSFNKLEPIKMPIITFDEEYEISGAEAPDVMVVDNEKLDALSLSQSNESQDSIVNRLLKQDEPDIRMIRWKAFPLWICIVVAVSLLVLAAGITVAATSYERLGGIDVGTYCRSFHYEGAAPNLLSCSGPSSLQIDMTKACNWQYSKEYPKHNLTAKTNDPQNPNGWLCYSPQNHQVGGIKDMNGYCMSQHYDEASLDGKETAKDWYCIYQPEHIDMTQVCNWQYHRIFAQARNNENVWECYGLAIGL